MIGDQQQFPSRLFSNATSAPMASPTPMPIPVADPVDAPEALVDAVEPSPEPTVLAALVAAVPAVVSVLGTAAATNEKTPQLSFNTYAHPSPVNPTNAAETTPSPAPQHVAPVDRQASEAVSQTNNVIPQLPAAEAVAANQTTSAHAALVAAATPTATNAPEISPVPASVAAGVADATALVDDTQTTVTVVQQAIAAGTLTVAQATSLIDALAAFVAEAAPLVQEVSLGCASFWSSKACSAQPAAVAPSIGTPTTPAGAAVRAALAARQKNAITRRPAGIPS